MEPEVGSCVVEPEGCVVEPELVVGSCVVELEGCVAEPELVVGSCVVEPEGCVAEPELVVGVCVVEPEGCVAEPELVVGVCVVEPKGCVAEPELIVGGCATNDIDDNDRGKLPGYILFCSKMAACFRSQSVDGYPCKNQYLLFWPSVNYCLLEVCRCVCVGKISSKFFSYYYEMVRQ